MVGFSGTLHEYHAHLRISSSPNSNNVSMARSDEATAFFFAVYRAVQEIPHGKVTSYGHIAMLVGTRTFGDLLCMASTVRFWMLSEFGS
jgi:O6-methylguanine-DNA--protein-cysteine methyltransferase